MRIVVSLLALTGITSPALTQDVAIPTGSKCNILTTSVSKKGNNVAGLKLTVGQVYRLGDLSVRANSMQYGPPEGSVWSLEAKGPSFRKNFRIPINQSARFTLCEQEVLISFENHVANGEVNSYLVVSIF